MWKDRQLYETMTEGFASMTDLFGRFRLFKDSHPMSERSTVLRFFQDQHFKHKDGSLFTGKDLGIRCGHLTTDSLYVVQSVYKDIKRRDGHEKAAKYFFGITKTQTV